jgi:hypothetical protein
MRIEFVVAAYPGLVQIRWDTELGSLKSDAYRRVEELLEELHGVESVLMRRYSCDLEIADHVKSSDLVADQVVLDLLADLEDGYLREYIRRGYPHFEFDVSKLVDPDLP